jgi:malate synthase
LDFYAFFSVWIGNGVVEGERAKGYMVAQAKFEVLSKSVDAAIEAAEKIFLTPAVAQFLLQLHERFDSARRDLLVERKKRQACLDGGESFDFLSATKNIREDLGWRVATCPSDIQDRKIEITGPVERKMMINALNSGANVFMADFEDSNSPTWSNIILGQQNLYDAVRRKIEFTSPEQKKYTLAEKTATLMVRPRGWHMSENHVRINGQPASASLFDFGFCFRN